MTTPAHRPDQAPGNLDITTYPAADSFTGPRPAALVLPGGGYRFHAPHEGEGYARWLSSIGIHAFVLHYPLLTTHRFPAPLQAARRALDRIRHGDHALPLDTTRVGVIGSSAGGHLAALLTTGTVMTGETPEAGSTGEALTTTPPRPDFAILAYAAADLNLLPDEPVTWILDGRTELRDELSPAQHIDAGTCPTFLWATAEDPPGFTNALAHAEALFTAGIPVELHIYPRGRHGIGLADGVRYGDHGDVHIPHTARWSAACAAWLRAEGLLPA